MKHAMAILVVALAVPGCHDHGALEEHRMASRGLTKDDLEAPPNDNAIRAAITRDVRETWLPEAELSNGLASCAGVRFEGAKPLCAFEKAPVVAVASQPDRMCSEPMKIFTIRNDAPDRQYPVYETTYFCPQHSLYWYNYQGGPRERNTWLGPRRLRFATRTQHD